MKNPDDTFDYLTCPNREFRKTYIKIKIYIITTKWKDQ